MSTAPVRGADPILVQLIASDEVYFRMAACVRLFDDHEIAHTPGFTHLPAGFVAQAVRFLGTKQDAVRWVEKLEREAVAVDAQLARVYLPSNGGPLAAALAEAGYRGRKEIAFAAHPLKLGVESQVKFHRVTAVEQWAERCRMHEEDPDNSDGYRVVPADWCKLIRRKCESGAKESYLIEYGGEICGSIGAIQMRDLLRLKNIVIRPAFRRQGLAREAVRELAALTLQRGLGTLAVFGIEGEGGVALYRSAGFSEIGSQTEWCKPMKPSARIIAKGN